MSLNELLAVVPSPNMPKDTGSLTEWSAVEQMMGTALPSDYRDFAMRYGSGQFNDPGRLCIFIRNPLSPLFFDQFRMDIDNLLHMKDALGDDEIPYAVFPEKAGLLLWGEDDNGNMLFWKTTGQPDNWPIMVYVPDEGFERLKMTMTSFLSEVFSGTLRCSVWSEPEFFSGPRRVKYAVNESDIE